MGYYVKEDAPNAVNLQRLRAADPLSGSEFDYRTFLPGEEIPESWSADVGKAMKADKNHHMHAYIESVGGKVEEDDEVPETPAAAPSTTVVDWNAESAEAVQAEFSARGLEVTGTGANGNVLKADMVAALQADDLGDNPFTS